MSIHRVLPKVAEHHSHELAIFANFISIDPESLSVVDILPNNAVEVEYLISWNAQEVEMLGNKVNTCSKSVVSFFRTDEGCYYPIYTITDYGDEGYYTSAGFYFSATDLFDLIKHELDSYEKLE